MKYHKRVLPVIINARDHFREKERWAKFKKNWSESSKH